MHEEGQGGVRERSGGGKVLQWLTVFVLAFILLRDRPLEKLWGGGGEFSSCRNFFRYQIPCINFF